MEVPVEFFAGKYTNSGKDNPAYKSIVELRDNFNSVAAAAENGKRYEIKFAEGSFYLDGTSSIIRNPNKLTINRFTIIGNIHDHPEWIGGGL